MPTQEKKRLKILENYEILEKCQIWLETQSSDQSSFHKSNFDNSCQKTSKIRRQIFEILSSFTGFLYFVPNILTRIVGLFMLYYVIHFSFLSSFSL